MTDDRALPPAEDRATAVEPVPVSPLRDGIPSAAELQDMLWFVAKWVERGLFDDAITAKEALNVIAYLPTMPWRNGRWDVDHKPYAAAFYAAFPNAQGTEARRAETHGGSVHDGPVAKPCAQGSQP